MIDNNTDGKTSRGNNVLVFKSPGVVTTQQSDAGLVFDYLQDGNAEPTTEVNVDAAHVNTFYLVNTMHDIAYR